MNHEELEAHMKEIFIPMDRAVADIRDSSGLGGFNAGYEMHDAAREKAPEWLRKWNDTHNWVICFTQGWDGLLTFARAFNWTKDRLLVSLFIYKEKFEDHNAVVQDS